MMVPKPCRLNTRSIGRRGIPFVSRSGREETIFSISFFKVSIPSPVTEETRTTGASSRMVSFSSFRISSSIMEIHSGSTVSHFVSTKIHFSIPRSFRISRCSLVCGIMPSSAATTISTISMPTTPETIC